MRRVARFLALSAVFSASFAAVIAASHLVVGAYDDVAHYLQIQKAHAVTYISERLELKPEQRIVLAEELPIDAIVKEVAREHQIPPLLLHALHIQESGRGLRTDRVRFEPHLLRRFKREAWMTDMEHQAMASSWGLGQIIYGIWKDFCGLNSYADLLDPYTNVDCSAKILRDCLNRSAKIKSKSERYRLCLSRYNGDMSGGYASKVLDHLTDLLLEEEL